MERLSCRYNFTPPLKVRGGGRGGVMLVILATLLSCGTLTTETEPPAPTPSTSAPTSYAVILAANFTDPIGTLNLVSLDPPREASTNLATTHSDALVRAFGGLLYVVNHKGADNIQVVDPADFSTRYQFSTGVGANPQDIVVVSPTKAYVTLYEPENNESEGLVVDDLLVFDPTTGTVVKTIDLTPYTNDDGDRFARASSLLSIGTKLFVAVQDMPGDLALPPDQAGKIVRIDTGSAGGTGRDEVDAAVILEGRDPFTMTASSETGKIYVGCTDFFDLSSPYGGIEVVDPATMATEGILLSDDAAGGWIGDIETSRGYGFAVVGAADFSENRVVRFSLDLTHPNPITLYTSDAYLQDIAVAPNGLLVVGETSVAKSGVVLIDPDTGEVADGPINVGSPPSSIAFVER